MLVIHFILNLKQVHLSTNTSVPSHFSTLQFTSNTQVKANSFLGNLGAPLRDNSEEGDMDWECNEDEDAHIEVIDESLAA